MVSHSTILDHVIAPNHGDLAEEVARYLLTLDFPASDQARYALLSEKAQAGALTESERAELDDYLHVNDFLTIVQAKARASLKDRSSAA